MNESVQEKQNSSTLGFDKKLLPEVLQDWIAYGGGTGSPEIFRLWSGLSMLSGCLERKCWLKTTGRPLYPNLFVLLVSPPGVGKNATLDDMISMWEELGDLSVAPKSMTAKAMIDELATETATRSVVAGGDWLHFQSMLLAVPELGTFMAEYDNQQISILNDLFDCGSRYSERTRGGGYIQIDNPHLVLAAGTQPKYLSRILPEHAFGMGLTSRIIMVYASESSEISSLFDQPDRCDKSWNKMKQVCQQIMNITGEFDVTQDAKEYIERRYKEGFPPKPEHPKLAHYNTRRPVHVLKLAMILGVASNVSGTITKSDAQLADTILLDADERMVEIFREMAGTEDSQVIRELHSYVVRHFFAGGRQPIDESVLTKYLQDQVPTWRIDHIIQTMLRSELLAQDNRYGKVQGANRKFIPLEWKEVG